MFRIRRIHDAVLPKDREVVASAQDILREQFHLLSEEEIEHLPELLRDPMAHGFRTILFSAEKNGRMQGFAILFHFPDLQFCYLDFLTVESGLMGRGVGGLLYERVREEAKALKACGLFYECLPDDPALCPEPKTLAQNVSRLRFYERYGARPVVGTAYETPLNKGEDCPPYLVLDPLDKAAPIGPRKARGIVRAILERKYEDVCPPEYVEAVVRSFTGPISLRPPRYGPLPVPARAVPRVPADKQYLLVVNARHDIHHVHERGYVEAPVRVSSILEKLLPTGLFSRIEPKTYPVWRIKAVHDPDYVNYLQRVCAKVPPGKSLYPYVFPVRNSARPPRDLPMRAGYYCIDTFTPLNQNAFKAARRAVDCALTAAEGLVEGRRLSYALVRPPGHHAERRAFGGFCYFNSTAIAAQHLSAWGRVAILDVDYHHGNGTQDIFYGRPDVLTVSIHGHPSFAYPYFSGFKDETGVGAGTGYNRNFPLPERVDGPTYVRVLKRAIALITDFDPVFLIVALGLDTAKGDPTGTFSLSAPDFQVNGEQLGRLGLPTLVVQEGGYRIRSLGTNARSFLRGLWEGYYGR